MSYLICNRAASPMEGNVGLTACIKSSEVVVKGKVKGAISMWKCKEGFEWQEVLLSWTLVGTWGSLCKLIWIPVTALYLGLRQIDGALQHAGILKKQPKRQQMPYWLAIPQYWDHWEDSTGPTFSSSFSLSLAHIKEKTVLPHVSCSCYLPRFPQNCLAPFSF